MEKAERANAPALKGTPSNLEGEKAERNEVKVNTLLCHFVKFATHYQLYALHWSLYPLT